MWYTVGAIILIGTFLAIFTYPMYGTSLEPEQYVVTEIPAKPVPRQSISSETVASVKAPLATSTGTIDMYELEKKIHERVNIERQKAGVGVLAWDERLAEVARKHSKDMAERGFFEHINPDGKSAFDRILVSEVRCPYGGENIAQIMNSGEIKQNSDAVVQGWLESGSHRLTMLRTSYTNEGIGVYVSGNLIYTTQNLCG